MFEGKADELF